MAAACQRGWVWHHVDPRLEQNEQLEILMTHREDITYKIRLH